MYVMAFKIALKDPKKPLQPLTSLTDLMPSWSPTQEPKFDPERKDLAKNFLKQGLLKQLLTEGEKYMFTWFSLMTLAEQGVYDTVANIGSLAARLVFSKIEESAYLYFSQTVQRGGGGGSDKNNKTVTKTLATLLRGLTLIGLVILAFGYSYSHLLLHIYGGENLSSGLGPSLLRGHCVFVLFMAINGVSECYAFATMTSDEVGDYNYLMSAMTAVFLGCAYAFAKAFGPIGFIMANCANFAMRIVHNFIVIYKKNGLEPLTGLFPPLKTAIVLVMSAVLCQLSERTVYDDANNFHSVLKHLVVGATCFVITMATILMQESQILHFLRSKSIKTD